MNTATDPISIASLKSRIEKCIEHEPTRRRLLSFMERTIEASRSASGPYRGDAFLRAAPPTLASPSFIPEANADPFAARMSIDILDYAPNGSSSLALEFPSALELEFEAGTLNSDSTESLSEGWQSSADEHEESGGGKEAPENEEGKESNDTPLWIPSATGIPTTSSCLGCLAHYPPTRLEPTVGWTNDILELCRGCRVSNAWIQLYRDRGALCDVWKVVGEGLSPSELSERWQDIAKRLMACETALCGLEMIRKLLDSFSDVRI